MSANTLGGYQIIREIGRSNDVVYEAVDPSINRRVALKELLLPPNLAGAQKRERVERFYREARAAGALSHPNIVTIYEAGEDHGRHFIAMEYLEGQTLRDVLEIEGKLSIERVVEIAVQVCDALTYAHSKGVIHRDIKPDNIQILPSGDIKITDFGIARIMEEPSLTADGQVFGTPSYMSPEQVAGKSLDARTDIFSLGILLYEVLTGRKPFTGDTVVTITYNIMNQDVAVPSSVPAYLERVLKRSLAKDPNLRYQSAAEVAADLDPSRAPDVLAAPPPDPFSVTTNVPGPLSAPHPQPPSVSLPDPFDRLKPGDLSPPRLPSKPIFSAEAKYFLKALLASVLIVGAVVGFIWLLSAAYEGYQREGREQEAQMHVEAGDRHLESQSYQAAFQEYKQAMKVSTDAETRRVISRRIGTVYIQLGIGSEHSGNPIQAIAFYKQALVYDDTFADAYLFLGSALDRMHRDDEALAAFGKAIEYGGGQKVGLTARQAAALLCHERGDEAYQRGSTDIAVQWWRRAVEIAPGTDAGFLAQEKIDRVVGGMQ